MINLLHSDIALENFWQEVSKIKENIGFWVFEKILGGELKPVTRRDSIPRLEIPDSKIDFLWLFIHS